MVLGALGRFKEEWGGGGGSQPLFFPGSLGSELWASRDNGDNNNKCVLERGWGRGGGGGRGVFNGKEGWVPPGKWALAGGGEAFTYN